MVDVPIRRTIRGSAPSLALIEGGHGEAIVFLHGLGSTKENWQPQIDYFARSYFVAAWDARGYGESEDYAGDLVFDRDFVADLRDVLDEMQIERAHLVGLSMGGLIAQCFHAAHSGRVASLVLADTFPSFADLGRQTVERFTATRLQPLLDGALPNDLAAATAAALLAPGASEAARATLVASLSGLRRESYIKTIRALLAQKAPAPLATIAVPTLLIVGELDGLSPPSVSARMADEIPGSQLVVIPGAGHMSSMEEPDLFNTSVTEFLARQTGRATRIGS